MLINPSEISKWNEVISSHYLSRLESGVNKYVMPNIHCPWGCTEYSHTCGHIDFDVVFQRYLLKCVLKLISTKESF